MVALDYGDVDDTLYAAAAKGADQVVKIPWRDAAAAAGRGAMYAEAVKALAADLVLVGVQAHDEMDGGLSPWPPPWACHTWA